MDKQADPAVVERIEGWAAAVEPGTDATLAAVMNHAGPPYSMPVETWAHAFGPTGGFLGAADVGLARQYGPLEPVALAMPYTVTRH